MYTHAKRQKGIKLMRLMLFTVTISSMSAQMFHVVLPQISEEFGLSMAQVSWLSSAYTLIYAFGTVTYGKLADRFQLKTLLTFGIGLFAAGSFIGLVSASFAAALLGRCLQSAGAAAVPALAQPLRVVNWNISNYSGGRAADLQTAIFGEYQGRSMAPDIIICEEFTSQNAVDFFLAVLNTVHKNQTRRKHAA